MPRCGSRRKYRREAAKMAKNPIIIGELGGAAQPAANYNQYNAIP
jgi:hypothetical protein